MPAESETRMMLSGKSAARFLNMSERTFRRLVDSGDIPCWTDPLTGRRRYPRLALERWAESFATVRAESKAGVA